MGALGGYFSLELPQLNVYHTGALALNTGRNCLEYILRVRRFKKVYIPFYSCDVMLEPLIKLNIKYEFYHINLRFEIREEYQLERGEALLYINYFGLKQEYVEELAIKYRDHLIIDNTQAFYARPIIGIDTFYSCRKFFGVPDGAYLYINKLLNETFEQDVSWERMNYLIKRIDIGAEAGYSDFKEHSQSLIGQPIKLMSNLTERLMRSIDYKVVSQCRRQNYLYLHHQLASINLLNLHLEEDAVPMVYPCLLSKRDIRGFLIEDKIFVPTYWPNVLRWTSSDDVENRLTCQTLFLPIDQRYNTNDMKYIIDSLNKWMLL